MTLDQVLDILFIAFIAYNLISGLMDGFLKKFINVAISLGIILLTYFTAPIVNRMLAEQNISVSFFKGSPNGKYLSALLSRHSLNALTYVVLFIVFSALVRAILKPIKKSFKEKKKEKRERLKMEGEDTLTSGTLLDRLLGALWAIITNTVFVGFMMVLIIPISGLENEINKTKVVKLVYNFSNSIGSTVTGGGEENDTNSYMICMMSGNQLTQAECSYIYSGILVLTTDALEGGFIDNLFSEFRPTYDYTADGTIELMDAYFQTFYAIPALWFLSVKEITEKELESATDLISSLLAYGEAIPDNVYQNDQLYYSIEQIYQHYGLEQYSNDILIKFTTPVPPVAEDA